jgi:hypothetical protein
MPSSSVGLTLVCVGIFLSSAAIGCTGQLHRDVALDKTQQPEAAAARLEAEAAKRDGDAAEIVALRQELERETEERRRGESSSAGRIVALEAVHAQMVARLQHIDDKVEEDCMRSRKVALIASAPKEQQNNGMLASPLPTSSRKPDCSAPFFMDQHGIKKPKLECM